MLLRSAARRLPRNSQSCADFAFASRDLSRGHCSMSTLSALTAPERSPYTPRGLVYYMTMAGIFSSAAILYVGINVQLFYAVLLGGGGLMLAMGYWRIPKWLLLLIAYLCCSGMIGIVRGTDSWTLVLKQVLGISVSAWYFWTFFKMEAGRTLPAFLTYAQLSVVVSAIGLAIVMAQLLWFGEIYRLKSVLAEPTFFATAVLPAWYYYIHEWLDNRQHRLSAIIITAALILCGSSNAYLSMMFGLCLLLRRYRLYLFLTPILLIVIVAGLREVFPYFKTRFDDTVNAVESNDVSGVNLSTYALLSNWYVATKVLSVHPLIGNGLGSNPVSYHRYVSSIPGVEFFEQMSMESMNAEDGASLAIRVASEQGLVGLALLAWFIFAFRVGGSSRHAHLSNAILLYFFIKLVRGGHYFFPEQFFFITVYILNWYEFQHERKYVTTISRLPLRATRP